MCIQVYDIVILTAVIVCIIHGPAVAHAVVNVQNYLVFVCLFKCVCCVQCAQVPLIWKFSL